MKVLIDAGHGGKDPGAIGSGLKEKDRALDFTLVVGKELERHNVEVSYSRTTDVFIDLGNRSNRANVVGADMFVSIHLNSFSNDTAQGFEVYYSNGSEQGSQLANNIHKEVIDAKLYTKDRGVKSANFYVLRNTKMKAVLIELGFISNKEDTQLLANKQNEMVQAIVKGILKNLGMKYIEKEVKPVEKKEAVSEWALKSWNKAINKKINDGIGAKNIVTEEQLMVFFDRLGLLD